MNAEAFDCSFLPWAHVYVSVLWLPNSIPVLLIFQPFSRVVLTVVPEKLSNFGSLVAIEAAFEISLWSLFNALNFARASPKALKNIVHSYEYSLSVKLAEPDISEVKRLIIFIDHWEKLAFYHSIHVYQLIRRLIVLYEISDISLTRNLHKIFSGNLSLTGIKLSVLWSFAIIFGEDGFEFQHIDLDELLFGLLFLLYFLLFAIVLSVLRFAFESLRALVIESMESMSLFVLSLAVSLDVERGALFVLGGGFDG